MGKKKEIIFIFFKKNKNLYKKKMENKLIPQNDKTFKEVKNLTDKLGTLEIENKQLKELLVQKWFQHDIFTKNYVNQPSLEDDNVGDQIAFLKERENSKNKFITTTCLLIFFIILVLFIFILLVVILIFVASKMK
jgi:hypothetical protein